MRRILVGYDGSAGAQRALERAIAETHESHGHITVVSVFNVPLDPDVPRNYGTLDDISELEGKTLPAPPDVVQHLTEAKDRLAEAGVRAELTWGAGPPGHVIAETASRIRADAIMVGEHHHGLLARFLGSDVGADIQREAGCDVILA